MRSLMPTSVSPWVSSQGGRMYDRAGIRDAIPGRGSCFDPTGQVVQLPEYIFHVLWKTVFPR